MRSLSSLLNRTLGHRLICLVLFGLSLFVFLYLVPNGVAAVTQGGKLAPKILDQFIMTWTPDGARALYSALGDSGREAYRQFYLGLDFWFPVLTLSLFYASLLSLAFPTGSVWQRLNLLPIALYLSDGAENLNHFIMAGSYPELSNFSLTVGPWFTFTKWVLIFAVPVIALLGLIFVRRSQATVLRGS